MCASHRIYSQNACPLKMLSNLRNLVRRWCAFTTPISPAQHPRSRLLHFKCQAPTQSNVTLCAGRSNHELQTARRTQVSAHATQLHGFPKKCPAHARTSHRLEQPHRKANCQPMRSRPRLPRLPAIREQTVAASPIAATNFPTSSYQ